MNNLLTHSFELAKPNKHGGHSGDMGMGAFFKQVTEIEHQIDKISTQLHRLQCSKDASQHVTKAAEMKEIKVQMEKDIDEVGRIALKAKTNLEELDKDNLANRKNPGCEKGTGVDRSRQVMAMALKKKLRDRMGDFQLLSSQNIHIEYRETVGRRFFTVTGTRPDEETIEKLIETGDSAKAIQGHGRGQIMDTLAEMQERHDAVVEIEKKLKDLQQMYVDLSVLVEAQGDMLNDIEAQVSSSIDHIQSATVTLQKAKKMQKNTRKYMCIAVLIFLVIVILALIPILKDQKLWNKQSRRIN